jgi:hypothetical protein
MAGKCRVFEPDDLAPAVARQCDGVAERRGFDEDGSRLGHADPPLRSSIAGSGRFVYLAATVQLLLISHLERTPTVKSLDAASILSEGRSWPVEKDDRGSWSGPVSIAARRDDRSRTSIRSPTARRGRRRTRGRGSGSAATSGRTGRKSRGTSAPRMSSGGRRGARMA